MTESSKPDSPSKRPGRPRGTRNESHKPATTTISFRAEDRDARRIQGLLAEGWLTNNRLPYGQIVLQALEEYMAARRPSRNKFVNTDIPPNYPVPRRYADPTAQKESDEFHAEVDARRRARDRLMGRR
jgi:hypothetical protein